MSIKKAAALIAAAVVTTCLSSTVADAAPAASTTGSTQIQIWSVNSDGPDFTAIATGAVGDYGPAVAVLPDGQVDPEHTHDLEFKFKQGTFLVDFAAADKALVRAFSHASFNPRNCSGAVTASAAAPVVAGSGTGAYRGITGSFGMKISVNEVDVKPVCNGTSPFVSQLILVTATGNVSY